MGTILSIAAIVVAVTTLMALAAALIWGVPFSVYHFWVNMPAIGRVARFSRLKTPTTPEANKRLDRIYRGYRKRISELTSMEQFRRASRYLFLAGDSGRRPFSLFSIAGLAALLAAEGFTFAFLLGGQVSPDASDEDVIRFAMLITAALVLLLAYFGHVVGGTLQRRNALIEAWRQAIDPSQDIPGETPIADLIRPVSVDDDQDRDHPRKQPDAGAQRRLNRVASHRGDRGKLWPTLVYAGFVLLMAYLQFELRVISNIATSAASIPFQSDLPEALTQATSDDKSAYTANIFFVVIFLVTQAFAVREGAKHTFLGNDGKRAYRITGGAASYEEFERSFDCRTRAADESLTNLLARFERYNRLRPDRALYLERVSRENADIPAPQDDGDNDPPAQAIDSNVMPLSMGGGGK